MDRGERVIQRIVNEISAGAAHWVPRPPERPLNPAPPRVTLEDRREYERSRKAAQRAKQTGRPS
ncbi:hypothetical protein QFZ91_004101 [Paraburkholderia sp. JPY419]